MKLYPLDGVCHHEIFFCKMCVIVRYQNRNISDEYYAYLFAPIKISLPSGSLFWRTIWSNALTLTLFAIQFLGPPPLAAAVVSLFSEHCDRPGGKNQSRSQSVLFSSHFSFFLALDGISTDAWGQRTGDLERLPVQGQTRSRSHRMVGGGESVSSRLED